MHQRLIQDLKAVTRVAHRDNMLMHKIAEKSEVFAQLAVDAIDAFEFYTYGPTEHRICLGTAFMTGEKVQLQLVASVRDHTDRPPAHENILKQVSDECQAQIAKWGIPNHPMLDHALLNRKGRCDAVRMAQEYEIPTETRAKYMLDQALQKGQLTYFHVLLEEVCEVVGCLDNPETMREELVQVAAVAVSMIACIDANRLEKESR